MQREGDGLPTPSDPSPSVLPRGPGGRLPALSPSSGAIASNLSKASSFLGKEAEYAACRRTSLTVDNLHVLQLDTYSRLAQATTPEANSADALLLRAAAAQATPTPGLARCGILFLVLCILKTLGF